MKEKQISVVLCTYNGEQYLREQLDSILGQTYPVYELIAQDDGSKDGTPSILRDYATRYPQVKVFTNKGPHGINANFFSAMRHASGDLIALSDQDDIWDKDKLRKQVAAIGDRLLCSGRSVPFSTDGYPVGHDTRRPEYHLLRLCYLGELPGHTLLISRRLPDFLPEGGAFPLLYDWQLQVVAAAAESVAYVDDTLVHFRRHASAATASKPTGHSILSGSALSYIRITLFHHRTLQRAVRERFRLILPLLDRLPFHTQALEDARQMARLQTKRGPVALLRRQAFFVRHRSHLFHVAERRPLIAILRALYFPFSCGYYYRFILNRKK